MKTRDKKDLHTRSIPELTKLLEEANAALFSIQLEKEQNLLKNTRSIFLKRKEIAAIKTVLRMKKGGEKV